jgi:hypothetical protein
MLTAILATQSSNVNVFAGTLEPIPEARLSGLAWYLFADPALIDTIEYAYLEGEEGLYHRAAYRFRGRRHRDQRPRRLRREGDRLARPVHEPRRLTTRD